MAMNEYERQLLMINHNQYRGRCKNCPEYGQYEILTTDNLSHNNLKCWLAFAEENGFEVKAKSAT